MEPTLRERAVLTLLQDGHSTADIATNLGVRVNTVYVYVRSLLMKAGVSSRVALVAKHTRGHAAHVCPFCGAVLDH